MAHVQSAVSDLLEAFRATRRLSLLDGRLTETAPG